MGTYEGIRRNKVIEVISYKSRPFSLLFSREDLIGQFNSLKAEEREAFRNHPNLKVFLIDDVVLISKASINQNLINRIDYLDNQHDWLIRRYWDREGKEASINLNRVVFW